MVSVITHSTKDNEQPCGDKENDKKDYMRDAHGCVVSGPFIQPIRPFSSAPTFDMYHCPPHRSWTLDALDHVCRDLLIAYLLPFDVFNSVIRWNRSWYHFVTMYSTEKWQTQHIDLCSKHDVAVERMLRCLLLVGDRIASLEIGLPPQLFWSSAYYCINEKPARVADVLHLLLIKCRKSLRFLKLSKWYYRFPLSCYGFDQLQCISLHGTTCISDYGCANHDQCPCDQQQVCKQPPILVLRSLDIGNIYRHDIPHEFLLRIRQLQSLKLDVYDDVAEDILSIIHANCQTLRSIDVCIANVDTVKHYDVKMCKAVMQCTQLRSLRFVVGQRKL